MNDINAYNVASFRWQLWTCLGFLAIFLFLNRRDLLSVLVRLKDKKLPAAVTMGLALGLGTLLIQALEVRELLAKLPIPRLFYKSPFLWVLAAVVGVAVVSWWRIRRPGERRAFSSTFVQSGWNLDETVVFLVLFIPAFLVLLSILPEPRNSVIIKCSGFLAAKKGEQLSKILKKIQKRSDLQDVYHYFNGEYLRMNPSLVEDPDSQFKRVGEASSLFPQAIRGRVAYANSFYNIDKSEHARRLDIIISDVEGSRMVDSGYYFYLRLIRLWPNYQVAEVEALRRRFEARHQAFYDKKDFSIKAPEGSAGNIFRSSEAIAIHFFFSVASMVAHSNGGSHVESHSRLEEARRQLDQLGAGELCWYFHYFQATSLCRRLAAITLEPGAPNRWPEIEGGFDIPAENTLRMRLRDEKGEEVWISIQVAR